MEYILEYDDFLNESILIAASIASATTAIVYLIDKKQTKKALYELMTNELDPIKREQIQNHLKVLTDNEIVYLNKNRKHIEGIADRVKYIQSLPKDHIDKDEKELLKLHYEIKDLAEFEGSLMKKVKKRLVKNNYQQLTRLQRMYYSIMPHMRLRKVVQK